MFNVSNESGNPATVGMSRDWMKNWCLVRETSQGAQSYSAEIKNRHDGRRAFLKECRESDSRERRLRMEREAHILVKMAGSVGVPTLFEASSAGTNRPYIVTEFVAGKRLNESVFAGETTGKDAVSIALALCDIVERLHDNGIYHRDVKPDNIMVTGISGSFHVNLVDYGSAYDDDDGFKTEVGVEMGNRFIRLPEYSSGVGSKRDPRSDLTMVAAVFFFMLVGVKPSVLQDHNGAHPHQWPDAKKKITGLDLNADRVARLFDCAFQMDIDRRFQSISALRDFLSATLEERTSADGEMSEEEIRERLFTPTEATRQAAAKERYDVLQSVSQTVVKFIAEFNGTVESSQSNWQNHPRKDATRTDLSLRLARDPRHEFVVRVKATTVGIESLVELSSDNVDPGELRVPRGGYNSAQAEAVREYFRRGLEKLLRNSDLSDAEIRRLTHEDAKKRAFDMIDAMMQSITYYLHMPAKNKLFEGKH